MATTTTSTTTPSLTPSASPFSEFEIEGYDVSVVDSCSRAASSHSRRAAEETYFPVRMNNREANSAHPFPDNRTRTTKYTPLTFLPKNLFEQYRKATNLYFLLIVIITLVPQISPFTPVTSILPVLFVLAVSALREAAEDYKRHRSDSVVNNQVYSVVTGRPGGESSKETLRSCDIKVGDVLVLHDGDRIPADVVVIKTDSTDGTCYLETSQLDGETNLKAFQAPAYTSDQKLEDLLARNVTIVSERPNPQLRSFQARMAIGSTGPVLSISEKNLLLQGATLRNTRFAIAVVVFTGRHTKLALNQRNPPSKFSRSEGVMNKFVLGVFVSKICLCVIAAALAAVLSDDSGIHWYLWGPGIKKDDQPSPGMSAIKGFFLYFALLSFIIPMSLMVTLEVVKFIQAAMMEWDEQMMHGSGEPGDTSPPLGMIAKTSSLNDELSLVKFVFSDKTGTLTENRMEFSSSSVKGVIYSRPMAGELLEAMKNLKLERRTAEYEGLLQYTLCLALCHSVVPERKANGEIEFQAQSPDEAALCKAARASGYTFCERTQRTVHLLTPDGDSQFALLAICEFSSDRRRMSVIVRDRDARITLYTKGADNVMLRLVGGINTPRELLTKTAGQLNDFSRIGLRTLVLARKELSDECFVEWQSRYDVAMTGIGNREEAVKELFGEIESDMELLGCTAVEDKLQEGVPETIHTLLRAGIQVWMITGDKQETAINIGKSCKLVSQDAVMLVADDLIESNCEERLAVLAAMAKVVTDGNSALVVNGASANVAVNDHPKLFMDVVSQVRSVICCQVTPLQKAQIVACVKSQTKDVCLSIGDGANDVSMIQTAHIGVGIFGREGTQAARASDYAIRQFRDLLRLLLIHGRYSMVRNSLLIKYSFFKNVAFFVTQFWWAFFCRFSSQSIYDDWMITFFNILYTSLPPFTIGLFEKDAPEDLICKHPELHRKMHTGYMFKISDLFVWLAYGVYHSIIFFFFAYFLMGLSSGMGISGHTSTLWDMSAYVNCYAIITVYLAYILARKYWTRWCVLSIAVCFSIFLFVWLLESFVPNVGYLYWTIPIVMAQPSFWLSLVVVPIVCVLPQIVQLFLRRQVWPPAWQVLLEEKKSLKAVSPDTPSVKSPA